MKANEEPITVELTFSNSVDTVWKALTEVDQMRQWFFESIPSFEPEVGFETQFDVQNEERNFLHIWKVKEVVPCRRIVCDWRYGEYPGRCLVVFELAEQDDLTSLKLTTQVLEDFPEEIPEFSRGSCLGGWTFFINTSLREYLEKS